MKTVPVFYTPAMSVATDSFSPSSTKPRLVVEDWLAAGLPIEIVEPRAALPIFAHDKAYIDGVMKGTISNGFGNRDPAVAESLRWTNGAVISATKAMIEAEGPAVACAPASGFHHAHFDHSKGFCTFNGLAAAAMMAAARVKRCAILDCDYHYGDGTDAILADHGHQHTHGGMVRHWSAGLEYHDPSQAARFLELLPVIIEDLTRACPVVLYQAGADPHVNDPLGGFLTTEQLAERDRIVFRALARKGRRVVWTLAGGYQSMPRLLEIHRNTMRICAEEFA